MSAASRPNGSTREDATVDVAVMIPNFFGGGAERMMVRIARGLRERGHSIEMVVCSDVGPFGKELGPDVPIIDLKSVQMRRSVGPIVRYLRQRRPLAVLVTLEHMTVTVLLASILARVRVRVVPRIATHLSACKRFGIRGMVQGVATRFLLRRADNLIAVSRGVAEDVIGWARVAPDKVHTIYSPFVDSELEFLAGQGAAHPFFSRADPCVVLAAGRLESVKDYPTLLEAFARVHSKRSPRLIILGEGPERNNLERLIRHHGLGDKVSLPGFVSNPFSYMARAAVFVLTSTREGLPGVLVQAMACGCPVVSTDCPSGPREILEGGRFGALVPVGDAEALAKAIELTIEAPRAPDLLRRRAQEFSAEVSIARHEIVLGL